MLIPVMHCFDQRYVIPAAVSLFSMLQHASRAHDYAVHVLHNGIGPHDMDRLSAMVEGFSNARIEFIDMHGRFADLFSTIVDQCHFSKEALYKLVVPSVLTRYDKVIVADVDVMYLGDISASFLGFDIRTDAYLAGCKLPLPRGSWLEDYEAHYRTKFSEEEMAGLYTAGGYYIFNLEKMRADGIEEKMIRCARENAHRLMQAEMDVINLVCHPKVVLLPLGTMMCGYHYDLYGSGSSLEDDPFHAAEDIRAALDAPVQLHWTTGIKPWTVPNCSHSELWHRTLFQTPFAKDYLDLLASRLHVPAG